MSMGKELAFAALLQADLSAAEAWKLLAPLVKAADDGAAYQLTEALRGWTWKALDRRRRDSALREWVDLLNRIEGFFADRFAGLAAKIEMMAELLHESLAVAELARPEDLLRRKHVPIILRVLAKQEGEWTERGALMDELGLRPANTTRLMSLLVDIGWCEQVMLGREAAYRLSAEGLALAGELGPAPAVNRAETSIGPVLRDSKEWVRVFEPYPSLFHEDDGGHGLSRSSRERAERWEFDPAYVGIKFDQTGYEDEIVDDEAMEDIPVLMSPRVLVAAGAGW